MIVHLRGQGGNYYADGGDSSLEIARTMIFDPVRALTTIFDGAGLLALVRMLLPLAIVLPFLAPEFMLLSVPFLYSNSIEV